MGAEGSGWWGKTVRAKYYDKQVDTVSRTWCYSKNYGNITLLKKSFLGQPSTANAFPDALLSNYEKGG